MRQAVVNNDPTTLALDALTWTLGDGARADRRLSAALLVIFVGVAIVLLGPLAARLLSLVLLLPEHRATESTIEQLAAVLNRHSGSTEVTLKLHRGGTAKVFEVPRPVTVTADLYGELKGLLGPQCLG